MPLRVRKNQAEPFTDYSKGTEPLLATSNESLRLRQDLERYTNGLIQGRSYLIAGHRGSGKTMLVHKAIEDLVRMSQRRESRPLFVRLHGPDLLPPIIENDGEAETQPAKENPCATPEKKAAKPEADPTKASGTPVTVPGTAPPPKPTSASDKEKQKETDKQLDVVLTQMMKSLFRDVSNEYRRCYRETVLRLADGVRRTDLLEVAAQFDLELTDYLTPSRLRTYWRRIGAFRNGILLTSDRSKYRTYTLPGYQPEVLSATDIGLQEILVLSLLSQAFQVISGTVEEKQKQIDAAKDERSSSLTTAYALKNLFGPIAGLVTGGFVGIQLGATSAVNPISAVLLGLLTGAVVSFSFTYTSTRSRSKEMSLESVFIKDRTVATLSSVLPLLVVRLREIGLAPVFVIDELDKVHNLKDRMQNLVRHLKFLVTENSFSCFLADRRYLTYLNSQASQNAYAPEYTYFSDHLVVLYRPAELREFIRQVLEIATQEQLPASQNPTQVSAQEEQDKVEIEKISYVLLHRARMHPIDLRRQLDSLTARTSFSMADSFPSPRSRFEILIQVTIEWLLDGDDVQASLSGTPYYRQVVYDALYYVSRLWEDAGADQPRVPGFKDFGIESDKKPGLELTKESFAAYIESRTKLEDRIESPKATIGANPKPPTIDQRLISGKDFEFLFRKVGELLDFLCKPENLISEIGRSPRQNKPPEIILNELPKDASLRLLIQNPDVKTKYRWLYDVSGRGLQTREVDEIIKDVEVQDAISDIREIVAALTKLGVSDDLYTMAEAKVIPRPTEWKMIVQPALDRLDRLRAEGNIYSNMDADRDAVVESDHTLKEFEPNLKAALISAAIFTPEVATSVTGSSVRFYTALMWVCRILQLSATAEVDLLRLSRLLMTVPGPFSHTVVVPAPETGPGNQLVIEAYEDELSRVVEFVEDWVKRSPTTPAQTEAITKTAWDTVKDRFNKHFRERTAWFDPEYGDVFTAIKQAGPGHELAADLSTITSRVWTKLLIRSLTEDKVPAWLRVAAAIELGMLELAANLATMIADDKPRLSVWVDDARRNESTQTSRRSILVLAAEPSSITENWKPSTRHAALVLTVTEFIQLGVPLKKYNIAWPGDYPIDSVAIELTGDSKALARLMSMKPQSAISEMSSSKAGSNSKELDQFLTRLPLCYFVNELPILQPSDFPTQGRIIVPKGLDDLIDQFFGEDGSGSA